jgi:hypothetical protein
MAHHNREDCTAWPCNPGPPAGHHAPAADPNEDDQTAGEARAEVQRPIRREDDSQ